VTLQAALESAADLARAEKAAATKRAYACALDAREVVAIII
jgi:hypothetical protein